ncbi:MAG: hypothetical protein JOZ39_11800 [Chloroflexi bacterium]|nr:hypothetical protein [Chloroflexota bacterium]
MAADVTIDERWYHGQGSALRVVEEAGELMTTKTLEQARADADAVSESDYIRWLSGNRKVGDIFKFKTRRGEAYILSW